MTPPNRSPHRFLLALTLVAIVTLFQFSSSQPAPALAQGPPGEPPLPHIAGPEIILEADPTYFPARVPPPPLPDDGLGIQAIPFTVNYNPPSCNGNIIAWSAQAQAAFSYAANIWASLLDGPIMPIEIDACYRTNLGTNTLGSAGSNGLYGLTIGGQTSFYPVALTNQLIGSDVNGGNAEINANFNANQAAWYFGTDGNPAFGQYDFVSVVLHEIGHGLGFSGSFNYDNGTGLQECNGTAGVGCWRSSGIPNIYDRFVENGSGQSLLNTGSFPNPSPALGSQLVSNNLYFDGPNTRAVNSNNPAKLYAPTTWSSGSSLSHLDEVFNNTPNALMTYSLNNGESAHHPGPVGLGVLRDLGWSLEDGAELLVNKSVSSTTLGGGDRLTYTLNVTNGGVAPVNGIVMTDIVPSNTTLDPASLSGDATYTGTSAGSTITWTTGQNLAQNQNLVRTFEVLAYDTIPSGASVSNTARATASNMDQTRQSNTVISLANGASCGFSDGFENGLSPFWTPQTTNTGQAAILNNSSVAHTGNYSVWFRDLTTDGTFSQSAFILNAFLAGATNVDFSFWVYRADSAPGTVDGVFLSDDGGTTWTKVHNFSSNAYQAFQNVVLDLDQLAATNGLSLNNNFRIKLQGDSDNNLYADGYVIDDVALSCSSPARGSLTVVKAATPADATNFVFDAGSMLGTFSLDDASPDDGDTVSDTQAFANLVAGTYQVTEVLPVNWTLTGVSCQGASASTITNVPNGVSINLAAGENVTCTFTNEQPTAIGLVSFTATPGTNGVTLTWETATEVDNAGYNLHRATAEDGPYTKINDTLIPAKGEATSGATYSYLDSAATDPDTIYYYKLEDIDFNTGSTFHGPVSTAPAINDSSSIFIYLPLLVK